MYTCTVKLLKSPGLGKVVLAVLTLGCAAAVVAVLIRAAPVTSSQGPARVEDNGLGGATLLPSASAQHRQEPTDGLSRMMTELRRLLPQAGEVLGAGLVWRDVHMRLRHEEQIRNKYIRAAAADPNAALDLVQVVGHTAREGAGTGYSLSLLESSSVAEAMAVAMTFTQRRLPPTPGLPDGTLTGLPIGERSWYAAVAPNRGAPPSREMYCNIVVHDTTIALDSRIDYPIDASDGSPGSERITDEDLLMAEYQARLILSAALLVANDFESMRRGEMTVGGSRVPTRRTADGVTLVPLARWAEAVGATVASGAPGRGVFPGGFVPVLPNSGVWSVTRGDRTVIVPLAARAVIVGSQRIDLPFPVVKSGDEVWVAVEAIEEALLR